MIKRPKTKLNLAIISNNRLINQKIVKTEFGSAKEVVAWMGAIQAQDYLMAKWAVGTRLLNSKDYVIENALNKGEIIRTHILRPTWHFVSSDDIYWMLELTAPQIKSSLRSRHKQLELTDVIHSKSKQIIEKALTKEMNLTREELSKEFHKAKIVTDNNRLSHLLLYAELDKIICSGPMKGKKQTYALLEDRVPLKKVSTRDESLAELARRYFASHGPATILDFAWWSGLSVKDARQALEFIKYKCVSEKFDSEEYWFTDSLGYTTFKKTDIHLLPAYDEFLISYKDRRASMMFTENKKVISNNGIFRPVIVMNGQVSGLWKCVRKNESVIIEIIFFQPQNTSIKKITEEVARTFGNFFGTTAKVIFKNDQDI